MKSPERGVQERKKYIIHYLMNVKVLRETFEKDVIKSNDENPIVNSREDRTCTKKGSKHCIQL